MNDDHNSTAFDCTDLKALLSAFVDGELPGDIRHDAERHLARCAECRALVTEAEANDRLLAGALVEGEVPLPDGFEQAVLSLTVDRRRADRWRSWLGWMAAAACLALAVTIWFTNRPARQQASPADARAASESPRPWNGSDAPKAMLAGLVINEVAQYPPDQAPRPLTRTPAPASGDERALPRETAEVFEATALLLDMLQQGAADSFADVERVRRIAVYEELLDRLAVAREELPAADRPAVMAVESMLYRIVRGPLSLQDLRDLRMDIARLDLPEQLGAITGARPGASSL